MGPPLLAPALAGAAGAAGQPAPPEELPRQRNRTTPQMHGPFPDYNVLDQVEHRDKETRAVVLGRLAPPGRLRFFTEAEAATLTAFCDLVTAQDGEPKIPYICDGSVMPTQGAANPALTIMPWPHAWPNV
jgi:hypothetical protein